MKKEPKGLVSPSVYGDGVCFACCGKALPSSQCVQDRVMFCISQFHSSGRICFSGHEFVTVICLDNFACFKQKHSRSRNT